MSVVNLHELASSATENHDAVHAILLALLSIKKLSVLTPTELTESNFMEKNAFRQEPTPKLIKARQYFSKLGPRKMIKAAERVKLQHAMCKFHIIQYHSISDEAIDEVTKAVGSRENSMATQANLFRVERQCTAESLAFLQNFFPRVIEMCNKEVGHGFWARCSEKQRKEILGKIYDNNPLYLLCKLHPAESQVVAFTELFVSNSSDRVKWRKFFRMKFVDMVEKAALCAETRWEMNMFWSRWATVDRVKELKMGNQFDLPAVALASNQKRKIKEEFEAGDYKVSKLRRTIPGS